MQGKMARYNGHPLLEKMPSSMLFQTNNGILVRVALPYPKSQTGYADIYVHKACVRGGTSKPSYDATFDVMLIDKTYALYYPFTDPKTHVTDLVTESTEHPVEEIYQMAMQGKALYEAERERELAKANKIPRWLKSKQNDRPIPLNMLSGEYLMADINMTPCF